MKLNTFITGYMTDGSKDKYVKSVINNDYVPYVEKCDDCERIIKSCHYKDVDGVRRFAINTPAQVMMFALLLVDRYTKIEVDYSPNTYDELQKSGALQMVISSLPDGEYDEYSAILHMVVDDCIANETNMALRFDDAKQAVASFVMSYLDTIETALKEGKINGNVLEGTSEGT